MTKSILTPVEHGEPLDRLALDQIGMVLGAHALQAHCGAPKFAPGPRRGLEACGKSYEPRRCCAHILKQISRSRNSPARAHFRTVISRGAAGLVLDRLSIGDSF